MEALSLPTTCLGSTSPGFLHGDKEFRKVENIPIWIKFTPKASQAEGQMGVCLQIMGPHSLSMVPSRYRGIPINVLEWASPR